MTESYATLWNEADARHLRMYAKRINDINKQIRRIGRKGNDRIKQELIDWRDSLIESNNNSIIKGGKLGDPIQRVKTGDLMTIRGISILASIMGGSSEQVFEWNAIGTSNQPESAADKALVAEIDRVWMPVSGFVSPSSNSVTYEGIYSPSLPSATIYENGVFSDLDPVNSVMLLRTVFDSPLNHTQNVTIPVFSQIIYLKAI